MKVCDLNNTILHPKLCFRSLGGLASARMRRLPAGATAAVFRLHLPVGSTGVSDIGMDKPEVGEYARPRSGGARLLCAITQCSFLHIAHLVIKLVTFELPTGQIQVGNIHLL